MVWINWFWTWTLNMHTSWASNVVYTWDKGLEEEACSGLYVFLFLSGISTNLFELWSWCFQHWSLQPLLWQRSSLLSRRISEAEARYSSACARSTKRANEGQIATILDSEVEQLSPIPPKRWWRRKGAKNAPFWHYWNGGRVRPDVPFILSKIAIMDPMDSIK